MAEITRAEHLAWCKERALEYVNMGDLRNAVTSMLSDLRKHPDTEKHIGGELGARLLVGGLLRTEREVKEWINGFN